MNIRDYKYLRDQYHYKRNTSESFGNNYFGGRAELEQDIKTKQIALVIYSGLGQGCDYGFYVKLKSLHHLEALLNNLGFEKKEVK